MKLLLLCGVDSTGQGGAPKSTLDLAVALRRRGHEVSLMGDYSQAPEEKRIIKKNDIGYSELSMTGAFSFPLGFLRKSVQESRPDMVISTHRGCDTMASLALLGTGIPQTSIIRMLPAAGTEHSLITDPIRNYLWYRALRSMSMIVGISDEVVGQIVSVMGVQRSKVVRIYNAVDTAYFSPPENSQRREFRRAWRIPENAVVALVVGRLEPVKRPLDVVPITERLVDLPLVFAYAGDGSLKKDVRQQFRRRNLQDNLLLMGKQSDMSSVYAGSDLLLHTGQNEAFGRTVIESYACGRPVVAVSSGGVRELVEHGETGFLFESGDVEAAARYIKILASDERKYASMSKSARKKAVTGFSLDELGENYEKAIKSVLFAS
jgi:glycosyltransferase involved in cell wall biosynthesis